MHPDIQKPAMESATFPRGPPDLPGSWASEIIHAIPLNGYQEPHPWICAVLFDETDFGKSPGCFFEEGSGISKMIVGVTPDSMAFSLGVPPELYHEIRQGLAAVIPVTFPDMHHDLAFPVGRWFEEGMAVFPAIIEKGDRDILIAVITRAGGVVHQLTVGYLLFSHPLSRSERSVLFEKLGRDPKIRFVMLEFPEG